MHYNSIAYHVERYIDQVEPEFVLNGLYILDSILKNARSKLGKNNIYQLRFEQQLPGTIRSTFKCPEKDKERVHRVINIWVKDGLFGREVFQELNEIVKGFFGKPLEGLEEKNPSHFVPPELVAQLEQTLNQIGTKVSVVDILSNIQQPEREPNPPQWDYNNNYKRGEDRYTPSNDRYEHHYYDEHSRGYSSDYRSNRSMMSPSYHSEKRYHEERYHDYPSYKRESRESYDRNPRSSSHDRSSSGRWSHPPSPPRQENDSSQDSMINCRSKSLYVGNIGSNVNEKTLDMVFNSYGVVIKMKYVYSKHCAFVTYETREMAEMAMYHLKKLPLDQRYLKVGWARPMEASKGTFDQDTGELSIPGNLLPSYQTEVVPIEKNTSQERKSEERNKSKENHRNEKKKNWNRKRNQNYHRRSSEYSSSRSSSGSISRSRSRYRSRDRSYSRSSRSSSSSSYYQDKSRSYRGRNYRRRSYSFSSGSSSSRSRSRSKSWSDTKRGRSRTVRKTAYNKMPKEMEDAIYHPLKFQTRNGMVENNYIRTSGLEHHNTSGTYDPLQATSGFKRERSYLSEQENLPSLKRRKLA
eukprot:TRINITY_DN5870_c0_g1_i3.p1 TRINITY_DN5870_c0_g1~~TRINITY_DN5870_c0_g1_i3.p1  ORF type:complete len:580 (+),score=94.13 TRINITY_DN5870_c0_g1_i3:163-1902(+)